MKEAYQLLHDARQTAWLERLCPEVRSVYELFVDTIGFSRAVAKARPFSPASAYPGLIGKHVRGFKAHALTYLHWGEFPRAVKDATAAWLDKLATERDGQAGKRSYEFIRKALHLHKGLLYYRDYRESELRRGQSSTAFTDKTITCLKLSINVLALASAHADKLPFEPPFADMTISSYRALHSRDQEQVIRDALWGIKFPYHVRRAVSMWILDVQDGPPAASATQPAPAPDTRPAQATKAPAPPAVAEIQRLAAEMAQRLAAAIAQAMQKGGTPQPPPPPQQPPPPRRRRDDPDYDDGEYWKPDDWTPDKEV